MSTTYALCATLVTCLAAATVASAQAASGTLAITLTVDNSIGLSVRSSAVVAGPTAGGLTVTGRPSGPALVSTLTLSIGNVSETYDHSTFAQLEVEPAQGVIWTLNGERLSGSAAVGVRSADGRVRSYRCEITAPRAAGAVTDNTIRLTAVAN